MTKYCYRCTDSSCQSSTKSCS